MNETNEVKVTVNGIEAKEITAYQMTEIFENSGYLETDFDEVEYLGIERNQIVFKYLNHDDEKWYSDYIFIGMDGNADFSGTCEDFDIDDEEKANEYYKNLK